MSDDRKPQAADKYIVRFPDGMRDRIAAAAKVANRSMNGEIVARLEASFASPTPAATLPPALQSLVDDYAEKNACTKEEALHTLLLKGFRPDAPAVVYFAQMPGRTVEEYLEIFTRARDTMPPNTYTVMDVAPPEFSKAKAVVKKRNT